MKSFARPRSLPSLEKKGTGSARINIAHSIFWSHFFRLPLKFHLRELPPRAANDNIFGRARFSQWDSRVTSSFSIITKYIGRILFRTMHPAYINNCGIRPFFCPWGQSLFAVFRARGETHLWKFRGNFPGAKLGVARSFFLRCAGKKSVNILPCIHVAYSVTPEKLTVYPLKNNVYDISSKLREFDEGAGETRRECERPGAGIFQNAGLNLHGSTRRLFREGNCFFFSQFHKTHFDCRSIIFFRSGEIIWPVSRLKLEKFIRRDQLIDNFHEK